MLFSCDTVLSCEDKTFNKIKKSKRTLSISFKSCAYQSIKIEIPKNLKNFNYIFDVYKKNLNFWLCHFNSKGAKYTH